MTEGRKIDMPVWDAEGRAAAAADRRALTRAVSRDAATLKARTEAMASTKAAEGASEAKPVILRGAMARRITTKDGQRVTETTLSELPD